MDEDKQPHTIKGTPFEKRPLRRVPTSQRFRPSPEEAPPRRRGKRIPRPEPLQPPVPPPLPLPATERAGAAAGVSAEMASPLPIASFLAIPGKYETDNPFRYPQPPDTNGAVGSQDLIAFTNRLVYVQKRDGDSVGFIDLEEFWDTDSDAFDPRVVWDKHAGKYICCSAANSRSEKSSLLLGVSSSADAAGDWWIFEMPASDFVPGYWIDYPMLGYSHDKIVVSCNMVKIGGKGAGNALMWVLNSDALNVNHEFFGSYFWTDDASYFPAQTPGESATTDVYLAKTYGTNGMNVYAFMGPASTAELAYLGTVTTESEWAEKPKNNKTFLPQKGTDIKLDADDTRVLGALYRDGALYVTHNIFLPANTSPTRCSVMWWEIAVAAGTQAPTVSQNGTYDDPSGEQFYAYPSIAVNWNGDVLVGFSTFGKDQYPSAAYALHAAYDPAGELRALYTFKNGDGYYAAGDLDYAPSKVYRWGDYSSTVIDPNDDVFWTIQEYALDEQSAGYFHAWSTYWAKVAPPASLGDKYLAWTGKDENLNVSTEDEETTTLDETSIDGPSLCVFSGLLYIGWTGTSKGSLNLRASADGVKFGSRNKLDEESIARPALCVFNGRLYIAWTGTSKGSLNLRASADGVEFGSRNKLDEESIAGPALCVFNDRLYIAWTGTGSGLNVMSSADGSNFGHKVSLDETCTGGPALAVFDGKLYVAWTGTSDGNLNLRASSDGVNFGARNKLDEESVAGPALLAAADLLYIAWTGTDQRRSLNLLSSADGENFFQREQLVDTSDHGPYLALFAPA